MLLLERTFLQRRGHDRYDIQKLLIITSLHILHVTGESLKYARCRHEGIIDPFECLKKMIDGGNTDHFLLGAQGVTLRHYARALPAVPLLFIQGQVPIMEPPADASKALTIAVREEKLSLTKDEQQAIYSFTL